MAFPDSTGAGKLSRWALIFMQCLKRRNWCLKGYRHFINPLQTLFTPPLPRKTCSALYIAHCTACPHCIQFGVVTSTVFYVLHTVWCGHQYSVLCLAYSLVWSPVQCCMSCIQFGVVTSTVFYVLHTVWCGHQYSVLCLAYSLVWSPVQCSMSCIQFGVVTSTVLYVLHTVWCGHQ